MTNQNHAKIAKQLIQDVETGGEAMGGLLIAAGRTDECGSNGLTEAEELVLARYMGSSRGVPTPLGRKFIVIFY